MILVNIFKLDRSQETFIFIFYFFTVYANIVRTCLCSFLRHYRNSVQFKETSPWVRERKKKKMHLYISDYVGFTFVKAV